MALTSELYNKEVKDKEVNHVNIGKEGCWAIGNMKRLRQQKYIKVSDGIYITSDTWNLTLEEGDITLNEAMTVQQLQSLMNERKKSTDEGIKQYQVDAVSPIYEFNYARHLSKNYDTIEVYIKLVNSELNVAEDNQFYKYSINRSDSSIYAYDIDTNSNSGVLFVKRGNNKNQYFWIGKLIEE